LKTQDERRMAGLCMRWGLMLLACLCTVVAAREAQPLAADPVLEAKVLHNAEEFRCLVCQNETIAA
jgi:cytochrome c-type biogenesis protein CcmH